MKRSTIVKHSVVLHGRKTSITLEHAFWVCLKFIALEEDKALTEVMSEIDRERRGNLSSATRVYVLDYVISHRPTWMLSVL